MKTKIIIGIIVMFFAISDYCGSVPQTQIKSLPYTALTDSDIKLISECYMVGLILSRESSKNEELAENPIVAAILAHALYTQAKTSERLGAYGDNGKP